VLAALRGLQAGRADRPAAQATLATSVQYLEARRGQIACAAFAAAGLPVGSGSVESANKLVVEARLQGGGRHWAPRHVDPLLALRNVGCNDRWAEAWPQIAARLRAAARRRQQRRAAVAAAPPPPPAPPPRPADPPGVRTLPTTRHDDPAPPPPGHRAATAPRTPAATHPRRRYRHPRHPKAA
jgi:hypothetical protein